MTRRRSVPDLAAHGRARRRPARGDRPDPRGADRGRARAGAQHARRPGAGRPGARLQRGDRAGSSPRGTNCRSSSSAPRASTWRPRTRCRCTCSSASARFPYAFEDGSLCVAIADPQNIHGIDELRLASQLSVVAPRRRTRGHRQRARAPRPHRRGLRSRVPGWTTDRARGDRRGGRRPRDRRRHLRRAARPARQLDHLPGGRGRRERHPLRAPARRDRRPLPHRRRPPREPAHPEAERDRRDDAAEGAREARHRRAAEAAGRPHLPECRRGRPDARRARRDAADGRRRVGRHAPARQVEEAADLRGGGPLPGDARAAVGS